MFRRSSAVATSREDHHQQRSGRAVLHPRWGRVCKKRHSRSVLVQKLTGIESNGPNENGCHFWFSLFAVAKACTHYRCRSQRLSGELRCLDVPHGTSCCGIFATLGEYFCPITLRGDFPVRMSQLDHVGGAPPLISSCKGGLSMARDLHMNYVRIGSLSIARALYWRAARRAGGPRQLPRSRHRH